jgi:hypothetical protein
VTDQKLVESPFDFFAANAIKSANGMTADYIGDGQRSQEGAT